MSRFRLDRDKGLLFVGNKPFPAESFDSEEIEVPEGHSYTRRARLAFESGWRLSIVWGDYTYSDNHYRRMGEPAPFQEEPRTVETYFLAPTEEEQPEGQEPLSYQTTEDVLRTIEYLNNNIPKEGP